MRTRIQQIADLLEATPDVEISESAIRELRGRRSQVQIATKAKISQAHLSDLESGKRGLTSDVAAKLAPVLGANPDDLVTAEHVSTLNNAALKGLVDPRRLLETIEELSWSLPDSEVSDALIDALLSVLKKALASYSEQSKVEAAAEEAVEEVLASTKTRKPTSTRDALGRRRSKPYERSF